MIGSLVAVSALLGSMGFGSDTTNVEVFKVVDTGHARIVKVPGSSQTKPMNLVLPGNVLRRSNRLSLALIQEIAAKAGSGQKVMSLNSTLHFDAKTLVNGSAFMTIGRSSVDPIQNTILFDITAGGGVKIIFDAKAGPGQYLIDATVAVVGAPSISSTIDQAFEQRKINAQTQHLCWFASTNGGKHTFELWTSTPAFVVLQGIDIVELK